MDYIRRRREQIAAAAAAAAAGRCPPPTSIPRCRGVYQDARTCAMRCPGHRVYEPMRVQQPPRVGGRCPPPLYYPRCFGAYQDPFTCHMRCPPRAPTRQHVRHAVKVPVACGGYVVPSPCVPDHTTYVDPRDCEIKCSFVPQRVNVD